MGSILCVTWPGGGNINPLVALGRQLIGRGHDVRVLGPEELRARFEADDVPFVAHRTVDEWTNGNPILWPDATDEQLNAYFRGMADDVTAELGRRSADLAFVDYMQPQALSAAEAAGVPVVAFVHTLYARVARGQYSPITMMGGPPRVNLLRDELGLPAVEQVTDLLDRVALVLVSSTESLDRPDRPVAAGVRYVGPIVEDAGPDAGWQPPAGDAPLVVVGMGTTDMGEAAALQRVLDAVGTLPVRALVTVGTHLDPGSFTAPANAVLSGYVRHAAVLPHAALIVNHAGLSTIGAALTFGVPMVCVPMGRDQPDNASHVEALGAGVRVDPEASSGEIAAAIARVLGDARFAAVAQREAAAIAAGRSRPVDVLEALLADVVPASG